MSAVDDLARRPFVDVVIYARSGGKKWGRGKPCGGAHDKDTDTVKLGVDREKVP